MTMTMTIAMITRMATITHMATTAMTMTMTTTTTTTINMFTPRTAAAPTAPPSLTAATAAALTLQAGPGQLLARLRIGQMDCPTEETLIRKKLGGLDGVHALDFNLMQRVLTVVHADGALDRITAAIKSLGMTPEPLAENAPRPPAPAAKPVNWWAIGGAGLMAALSEFSHFAGWSVYVTAALAVAAILACGLDTYRKGWIAVRNGNLNINALMSIAVTGAVLIGQWPEAAMVMFLFNVAELIEARSLDRARNAIRGLLDLAPRPPRAGSPTARGKRCRPRNCSQATSCACGPANASPPTARSSAPLGRGPVAHHR